MKPVRFGVLLMLFVLLFAMTPLLVSPINTISFAFAQQNTVNGCDAILPTLSTHLTSGCGNLNTGTACYGNQNLTVQYRGSTPATTSFQVPGDQSPVEVFSSIHTEPFNPTNDDWGVALLQIAARRLEKVINGKQVTFIIYGDTTLIDHSGNAAPTSSDNATLENYGAFYFTSTVGAQSECEDQLPSGGLIINAPERDNPSEEDAHIEFNANGVDIVLGSMVLLQADTNGMMVVNVLRGTAIVTALGQTQTATRLQQITIPIANFAPQGPPSVPIPIALDIQHMAVACKLAEWSGIQSPCVDRAVVTTPTPVSTCSALVNGPSANLRSAPQVLPSTLVGTAQRGDTFSVSGQASGATYIWYLVRGSDEASYWVSGSVIALSGDCSQVPEVAPNPIIQPPPSATSTTPVCTPRTDWVIYVVPFGDTLGRIAAASGSSINGLVVANCLVDANRIFAGQRLRVPRPVSPPPPPPPSPEPMALPDLTVTLADGRPHLDCSEGMQAAPKSMQTPQCSVTVDFVITNPSAVNIRTSFNVFVQANNVPSQVIQQLGIPADQSIRLKVTLGPGDNCYNPNCTVRVLVDSDNFVPEYKEDNNVDTRTFEG